MVRLRSGIKTRDSDVGNPPSSAAKAEPKGADQASAQAPDTSKRKRQRRGSAAEAETPKEAKQVQAAPAQDAEAATAAKEAKSGESQASSVKLRRSRRGSTTSEKDEPVEESTKPEAENNAVKPRRSRRGSSVSSEKDIAIATSTEETKSASPVKTRRSRRGSSVSSEKDIAVATSTEETESASPVKTSRSRRGSSASSGATNEAQGETLPKSPPRKTRKSTAAAASEKNESEIETNGTNHESHVASVSDANTNVQKNDDNARDITVHRCSFVDFKPEGIVALAGSTTWLAVGRSCGTVELWQKIGSNLQPSVIVPGLRTKGLRALTWQSNRLFGCCLDGSLVEVDFATMTQHYVDPVGGGGIWGIDSNSNYIACACEDGKVRLFTPRHLTPGLDLARVLSGAITNRLLCVKFHPSNEDVLYTGGMDARIRKWSIKQKRVVDQISIPLLARSIAVWTIDCAGNALACGDSLGRVHIWPEGEQGTLVTFSEHRADVLSVKFSSDARSLYASGVDSRVAAFRFALDKWVYAYSHRAHTHDVHGLALVDTDASEMLCSAGVDAQLVAYPCQSFEKARPKKNSPFPQREDVKIVPFGKGWLLLVLHRFKAELWFLQNAERKHHYLAEFVFDESTELRCGDISNDGSVVAVADDVNGLSLFRIEFENKKALQDGQPSKAGIGIEKVSFGKGLVESNILSLLFVGSEQMLMVGSANSMQLLDVESCNIIKSFPSSAGAIISLTASDDGQWVAAACMSSSLDVPEIVEVFNLDAMRSVGVLSGSLLEGRHGAFRFSPQSSELIIVRTNGSAFGINVEEGLKIAWTSQQQWGFADRPVGIAFNPAEPDAIIVWSWSSMFVLEKGQGKSDARTLKKFKPIIHAEYLGKDELFILEAPFVQALKHLPDVLERERYGT